MSFTARLALHLILERGAMEFCTVRKGWRMEDRAVLKDVYARAKGVTISIAGLYGFLIRAKLQEVGECDVNLWTSQACLSAAVLLSLPDSTQLPK